MQRHILWASVCLMLVSGCASSSADVEATHTPMDYYAALSCDSLYAERERLTGEITALSATIDAGSAGERLAMGLGVVFWPALFMIDGKGEEQDKLALLKGQKMSIEDSLIERNCPPPQPKLRANQPSPQANARVLMMPDAS